MVSRMQQVLGGFTKIDDDLFDELEETMITSDLGPETSVQICETLRKRVKERGVKDPQEIMGMIQEIIGEMLGEDQTLEYPTQPTIVMVIGVNGAGKTTTIGKLCHQLKGEGKRCWWLRRIHSVLRQLISWKSGHSVPAWTSSSMQRALTLHRWCMMPLMPPRHGAVTC